jgi:hypothetical protein
VHGSAVKGGIIPGCSDIDFQLYLEPTAFSWEGQLPLPLGFAIRRDLGQMNLTPFRYIQCYALTSTPPEGWVGPIPGTYHLVAGQLPVTEATAEELRASAREALSKLNTAPTYIVGKLLGPGQVRMGRALRLLCTQVWPTLYQVLTLQEDDPIEVWCLRKDQAISLLPRDSALHVPIGRFYQAVQAYYPAEDALEEALSIIKYGIGFLEAAKAWWETQGVSA